MKTALITITTLLFAAVAQAQDPIFPPLVAGEYSFHIQTHAVPVDGNGIPLQTGAVSVAVFDVGDPGVTIKCLDCQPGDLIAASIVVPAVGDRIELRARAYESAGCIGMTSPDSPNAAYVYFTGPVAPVIAE